MCVYNVYMCVARTQQDLVLFFCSQSRTRSSRIFPLAPIRFLLPRSTFTLRGDPTTRETRIICAMHVPRCTPSLFLPDRAAHRDFNSWFNSMRIVRVQVDCVRFPLSKKRQSVQKKEKKRLLVLLILGFTRENINVKFTSYLRNIIEYSKQFANQYFSLKIEYIKFSYKLNFQTL